MEAGFVQLCSGHLPLQDLPSVSPRSITFCLISAFTDFEKEREILRNEAYPQLYEFFRNTYGLQFRAVDIKLGLEKVNFDELDYWDLFHEMKRKFALASHDSVPVILLGQKFGLPLLPKRIPTRAFQLIRATLRAHRNPLTSQYAVLDTWYMRDENALRQDGDTEHVLVPARHLLPDMVSSDPETKAAAVLQWKTTANLLANLLKVGVGICLREATMDDHTAFELLTFELDSGVSHLLAHSDLSLFRPIVFEREIVDLKNYVDEEKAAGFTDVELDEEKGCHVADSSLADLLQELNDRITTFATVDRQFSVLWRFPDGVDKRLHQEYLGDFCDAFIEAAKAAVHSRLLGKQIHADTEIIRIFDDAWTSLERCRVLAPFCIQQEHTLDALFEYCTDISADPNFSFLLHGGANSGKLPAVAKAFTQLQQHVAQLRRGEIDADEALQAWGSAVMVIPRIVMFEQRLSDLVASLFNQIRTCFDLDGEYTPANLQELVDGVGECPLILLVGGAERLLDSSGCRVPLQQLVPQSLPSNVKLVLTCLAEQEPNVLSLGVDNLRVLHVNPLEAEACRLFVQQFMAEHGRRLTEEQWQRVDALLPHIHSMFHASLLCDRLARLCSADEADALPASIAEFFDFVFEQLERKFGLTMVQHTFSFLSLSRTGLTDTEIVDLLSLDDAVLDEMLVPIEDGIRRFPSSVWLLLKQEIHLLIQESSFDGYFVNFWTNEEVAEAVDRRYLQSEEQRKSLHFTMADYFLGTWHAVNKPVSTAESADEVLSANRLMPSQQLVYVSGEKHFYNDRQFRQLPRHLFLSDRIPELNNLVLFSYDWLYYKSVSLGLEETLRDFELVPQNVEVTLVEETIRKATPTLTDNLKNLAAEISGNLVTYSYLYKNIKNLVRQADIRGCQHNIFVPTYSYAKLPGSALQSTVECPSRLQSMALRDGILYVKLQDDVNLYKYDLERNTMLEEVRVSSGRMFLSSDEQFAVMVDDDKSNHLRVHRVSDGSYVGHVLPLNWIDTVPFEEKHMFRLTKVKVGRELVACIIASRVSYVIIANLATCQPVHVFKPERRAALCDLTPDERFILTNNGEQVLVFEIGNGVQTSAVDLLALPKKLTFTKNGSRAFILCEGEQKVVILYMDAKGGIEMSYKIMFENTLADDSLLDMRVSQSEQLLLVRAERNVLVYEFGRDAIVTHIRRPPEIPTEFKMPNSNYERINFSEAEFAFDDRVVITSIFRDVLVWEVADGKPLVMLHAPTGILSELLVDQARSMLVGYIDHSREIHLWSLQGAFTDGTVIDCLTAPVKAIRSIRSPRAVACCENSDEMGVVDLNTGFLTDLYSHEGVVLDCVLTSCGNYAVATVMQRSPDTTNIVWSLSERKILAEFGNVPGHLLACQTRSDVFVVDQAEAAYRQPFRVNRVTIQDGAVQVSQCSADIPFLLSRPFITTNDKLLVCLSGKDLIEPKAYHVEPFIFTWNLETGQTRSVGPSMLSAFGLVRRLLDVRSCHSSTCVAIVYSEEEEDLDSTRCPDPDRFAKGVLLVDLETLGLRRIAAEMLPPGTAPANLAFSRSGDFCLDVSSNTLFSVEASAMLQQAAPAYLCFRGFALEDSLMIFTVDSFVCSFRVPGCGLAGKLDVHHRVRELQIRDDNTLLVGTDAGNILSFLLVDSGSEKDVLDAVQAIPSREILDGERARSWDRLVRSPGGDIDYSRPPSKMRARAADDSVELRRAKSDTEAADMNRARSCALM